jgi:protein-tyrosine phosphatase
MVLIGLSILTTYQHHFIDLPTGLAAGFLVLWLFPENEQSPLRRLAFTADRVRRRVAARYALGAVIVTAVACQGGAWLWLFWPAGSLALVALNYAATGARGFQKGAGGRLSLGASYLFAPYLAAAWTNSRLWTRHHPAPAAVLDGVSIGRIPTTSDLASSSFGAVVDLAAELPCGAPADRFYRSVPVLDLTVPGTNELRVAAQAIEEGRQRGTVLVCCALGYSRSAAAIIAWLLTTRRAETVGAAIQIVRQARPSIVLRNEHSAALEAFA